MHNESSTHPYVIHKFRLDSLWVCPAQVMRHEDMRMVWTEYCIHQCIYVCSARMVGHACMQSIHARPPMYLCVPSAAEHKASEACHTPQCGVRPITNNTIISLYTVKSNYSIVFIWLIFIKYRGRRVTRQVKPNWWTCDAWKVSKPVHDHIIARHIVRNHVKLPCVTLHRTALLVIQ